MPLLLVHSCAFSGASTPNNLTRVPSTCTACPLNSFVHSNAPPVINVNSRMGHSPEVCKGTRSNLKCVPIYDARAALQLCHGRRQRLRVQHSKSAGDSYQGSGRDAGPPHLAPRANPHAVAGCSVAIPALPPPVTAVGSAAGWTQVRRARAQPAPGDGVGPGPGGGLVAGPATARHGWPVPLCREAGPAQWRPRQRWAGRSGLRRSLLSSTASWRSPESAPSRPGTVSGVRYPVSGPRV